MPNDDCYLHVVLVTVTAQQPLPVHSNIHARRIDGRGCAPSLAILTPVCVCWQMERQSLDSELWREKYKTLETSIQAKVEALERCV